MKILFYLCLLTLLSLEKVNAQSDSILVKDIPNFVNKSVTIQTQVIDFDSRRDYWYLYIGDHYPNQLFTILIKKYNRNKLVKLNMDILLGRKIVFFTGVVTEFHGLPDSSTNTEINKLRKEIERPHPMTIGETSGMGYLGYMPRTGPIDLRGKLIMIITDKKQIGKSKPALVSLY